MMLRYLSLGWVHRNRTCLKTGILQWQKDRRIVFCVEKYKKQPFIILLKRFFSMPSFQGSPLLYMDPNTSSNYKDFKVNHFHLDLKPDFSTRHIEARVIYDMDTSQSTIERGKTLILDTKHLNILNVHSISKERDLKFDMVPTPERLSDSLYIYFEDITDLEKFYIDYKVIPMSSAVQWLTPVQTIGKKHPYLFTQLQPIHARALFPCQDTPSVKATYSAQVSLPEGLSAVMSAKLVKKENTTFYFEQRVKIPSYLVALAAGNIYGKNIGPRSTVYCEPEQLDSAAFEFEDTEEFIAIGEKLVGPYIWDRYDILVLPPGFPFGGMENPCLTFVTPALLAGDKSLVDVIAHEISHSWTGNLVTSASWEHFWLNEGFTMFLERKILGRKHGELERQFSALVGLSDLREAVADFGESHPFTALVPQLQGKDPDDAFSTVPYEKGHTFLYYLEELVGSSELFEAFFAAYIKHYAHTSITTEDWKNYLLDFFKSHHEISERLSHVDWKNWLYSPGMPPLIPKYNDELLKETIALTERWMSLSLPTTSEAFEKLSVWQKVSFLNKFLNEKIILPQSTLSLMDRLYSLSETRNVEISFRWLELCLRSNYKAVVPMVEAFLSRNGRMKYLRPLYRALAALDHGEGLKLARDIFKNNKEVYHPIASKMIAKDLKLN